MKERERERGKKGGRCSRRGSGNSNERKREREGDKWCSNAQDELEERWRRNDKIINKVKKMQGKGVKK